MRTSAPSSSRGSALLEVLITIVILAFGLLGIAGLQARVFTMEFESYQRAQAIAAMNDIAERIATNSAARDTYVAASPLGGGALADCSATTGAARDICEWGNLLRGSGEVKSGGGVGGMENARACLSLYRSAAIFGHCQIGIQIEVVWRGRSPTIVPAASCGTAGVSPPYSSTDTYRRAVSTRIGTGDVTSASDPSCV